MKYDFIRGHMGGNIIVLLHGNQFQPAQELEQAVKILGPHYLAGHEAGLLYASAGGADLAVNRRACLEMFYQCLRRPDTGSGESPGRNRPGPHIRDPDCGAGHGGGLKNGGGPCQNRRGNVCRKSRPCLEQHAIIYPRDLCRGRWTGGDKGDSRIPCL